MSTDLSSRPKSGPWPGTITAPDTRAARARIARHTLAHVPPADRITLALLALVTLVVAIATMIGRPLAGALAQHVGILAGYALLALVLARNAGAGWAAPVRGVAIIGVMFTLYLTLGHVAFEAMPYLADPTLDVWDAALFGGTAPALWAERFVTPGRTWLLAFAYAAYVPYLYVSILLGLLGRPDEERDIFVTGVAIVYALGFIGYLFAPARGPVVYNAADFAGPLPPNAILELIMASVANAGGPHGAMPSLHVGVAAFLCAFDLRFNRLRGMAYVPLVLLIGAATVYLRYHYAIDILAGLAIALLAVYAAPLLQRGHRRRIGEEQ